MFFIFAITGFFHAALLRPWPLTIAGVAATSILINTIITGFPWRSSDLWILYGAIIVIQIVAIGFGTVFGERLSELSEQRRQAVDQLQVAMDENVGLQRQLVAQAREAGVLDERAAHGARDPRHDRPRPDRHRHPAGGGRAGAAIDATTGGATSTTRSGWLAKAWRRRGGRSRHRARRCWRA